MAWHFPSIPIQRMMHQRDLRLSALLTPYPPTQPTNATHTQRVTMPTSTATTRIRSRRRRRQWQPTLLLFLLLLFHIMTSSHAFLLPFPKPPPPRTTPLRSSSSSSSSLDAGELKRLLADAQDTITANKASLDLTQIQGQIDYHEQEAAQEGFWYVSPPTHPPHSPSIHAPTSPHTHYSIPFSPLCIHLFLSTHTSSTHPPTHPPIHPPTHPPKGMLPIKPKKSSPPSPA